MNGIIKWLLKAAAAGIIALLLLCLWCSFYYNVPVHFANDTGATEYRWESGKLYRRGTEGFAINKTNNDGFNNLGDYEEGEQVDILLMGSSHMEAFNVPADKSAAAELNRLFADEKYTYNIGTSGHTLLYCVKHLESAIDTYAPKEYVVIETSALSFPKEQIEMTLEGSLPDIPSHNGGLVMLMQRFCYLRLFYTKYVKGMNDAGDTEAEVPAGSAEALDSALLDRLMAKVGDACKTRKVQPIVVYHSFVVSDENGKAYTETDAAELLAFRKACEDNGVIFLDLEDSFVDAYENEKKLPYGFLNTQPGMGHMNSFGQALFAQGVYETIMGLEQAG